MITSTLYAENYNATEKVVINQGGTWSGKTYAILEVLLTKALERPNTTVTVTAQDRPSLKRDAHRAFQRIVTEQGFKDYVKEFNKTELMYTLVNGSVIEFVSYEDEEDAKQGKRHYLFINEATREDYYVAWQLMIRTEFQTFIDYNPTSSFWVHDKFQGQPEARFIYSDHRHNQFLSEAQHNEIESIKDPELWRVYARGATGNIIGTIYPNWTQRDWQPCEEVIWGVDYGYTTDPTAIVKIGILERRTAQIKEICYTPGLSADTIKDVLIANGYDGEPIYSEHDTEMVSQLRRLGLRVLLARKGDGSIKNGILKVKEFEIFYTPDSMNLHQERLRYKWAQVNGVQVNKPDDTPDHLCDSIRYALYTHTFGN